MVLSVCHRRAGPNPAAEVGLRAAASHSRDLNHSRDQEVIFRVALGPDTAK